MLNSTCHACSQPTTVWIYLNGDPVACCAIHNPYDFGGGVHAAEQRIVAMEAELAALRTWKASAVPLLRALAGYTALRWNHFDRQYCGEQSFKRFAPGGAIEAGWEHAPDCPVAAARALLAESEASE